MKRPRRPAEPGDFEDPLSNYDPKQYEDPFEKSLCEGRLASLMTRPAISVTSDTPVRRVLEMMAEQNIACIVVRSKGKPVGLLSERDVLNRVAEHYEDLKDQPIAEVMTPDPVVLHEIDCPARALNVMSLGGFRHVPVVDADGNIVGMIGARRITAYLQSHFSEVLGA